jgi:GT2 family glycosyltransferase
MSYAIVDLELTRPLPVLELAAHEDGVGILLRRHDRPIGFCLVPLPAGATLDQHELGALVAAELSLDIVRAGIEDELAGKRPQTPALDLTLAICTRDRPELLGACLASILRVQEAAPRRFQVMVVDNAPSTPATRDLVASLEGVRYVREPRPGLDFARNRALAEVRSKFVAFVDDDAVLDRGWLGGLEDAWAHDPAAVCVTGLVLPYELATAAQIAFEGSGGFRRGFQRIRYAGLHIDRVPGYPLWVGRFGSGCNMAFRVDDLRRLGGFDEALDTGPPLPGGGDLDIFYRVLRAGHALVYEPRALVFHRHRRDRRALRHQYWTWGTSFMAFLHKTYRSDPLMRPRIRHIAVSWLWGHAAGAAAGVGRRSPLSPDLALAPVAGGLLTFLWMYPRSRWLTRRISRCHPTA